MTREELVAKIPELKELSKHVWNAIFIDEALRSQFEKKNEDYDLLHDCVLKTATCVIDTDKAIEDYLEARKGD